MRDDVLQKLTTKLANCYGIIGMEDLHLKGLLKNGLIARSFSDAALGKLLTLLTSKVEQRGGQVMKVGRFFPSSKTCHGCGWKWEDMECLIVSFSVKTPPAPIISFHKIVITMLALNILRGSPSLDRVD